jgi:helicase
MKLLDLKGKIPDEQFTVLSTEISELRPAQEKSINAGLLENNNLLVCTPTASGKTLIAELAALKKILRSHEKVIYIAPLKALANEKFKNFKKRYGKLAKIAMSIGDIDSADPYLQNYDLIITTPEKLDSLIRHHSPWLRDIGLVIIDEIHLLNDSSRGPTLEIILTILKSVLKGVQILGLSATIGNPQELGDWLDAKVVEDNWRPVDLHKGVYLEGEIEFIKKKKKN